MTESHTAEGMREALRLAGWNVNGLRARFDNLGAWLDERRPDVVALHELRCPPPTSRAILASTGRNAVVGEHAAILAAPELGPLSDEVDLMDDGRAIVATVGRTRVASVYAPNGGKANTAPHDAKLRWFGDFAAELERELARSVEAGTAFVLLGDLNIARAEIDIWAPERYRRRNLFTVEERQALQALLDLGLHDVIRAAHPGRGLYTWWNHAHDSFARKRGWRLDYALTSAAVADRVNHAVIDVHERARPGTSDHAPLWIDLEP